MIPLHLIPKCISSEEPRNSSFNRREREAIRLYLIIRDGSNCKICGNPASANEVLDIDHIDGNKKNSHHTNLQLVHHDCNCNKNKKGWNRKLKKGVDTLCVYDAINKNDDILINSAELKLKTIYYPAFMQYVVDKFIKQGLAIIDVKDMARNLFVRTGGSTVTFERYARDLCGSETPYAIINDPTDKKIKYLTLKPDADLTMIMVKKYVKD